MTRSSIGLLMFLTAPLLIVSGSVRADYLNWTYSTSTNPPVVSSGATLPTGGGAVQLTGYLNHAGGPSVPVIGYDTVASVPIHFDSHYSMALTIRDNATYHSGTLTFTGSIQGDLTPTTSTLVNSFGAPQSLTLDGRVYTVSISQANLAAPPSSQQDILATIRVNTVTGQDEGGGKDVHGSPEPGTLVLGGLGLSSVGARHCWNRVRRFLRQSV